MLFDKYTQQYDKKSAKTIAEGGIPLKEPANDVFFDPEGWQLLIRYIDGWIHTDRRGTVATGRDQLKRNCMKRKIWNMVRGVNQGPITLKEWGRRPICSNSGRDMCG